MDEGVTQANRDAMNKLFEGKITITASYLTKYYESILNGTDPVLKDGLIPVTISNDGTVRKADITKEWYRYEKQEWANAVILEDENQVYRDGQIIPESNIESYFVWIPRYKYKIWDMGEYEGLSENIDTTQVHQIEVIFGTDTTVDSATECRTPMLSGESGNCSIGKYMTHPAFISFGTNGLWVGKFETGYKDASSKEEAQKNVNEPNSIQIKPNVYSWRGIQVANAHLSSYNYKREYDSHMMKNTEWGAVAYLQHSAYGSHESVRINNNSYYKTGYSAINEPSCGNTGVNEECNQYGNTNDITKSWNTNIGEKASTTGNISGIYDMSGGAWEYMMSIMLDKNSNPMSGRNSLYNSGFNGSFGCPTCDEDISRLTSLTTGVLFPTNAKYMDTYVYSDNNSYNYRILGDATGEMGSFIIKSYSSKVDDRQIGS